MCRPQLAFKTYFHRFFLHCFLGSLIIVFVIFSGLDLASTLDASETYRPADMMEVVNYDPVKLNLGIFIGNLYDVIVVWGRFLQMVYFGGSGTTYTKKLEALMW